MTSRWSAPPAKQSRHCKFEIEAARPLRQLRITSRSAHTTAPHLTATEEQEVARGRFGIAVGSVLRVFSVQRLPNVLFT